MKKQWQASPGDHHSHDSVAHLSKIITHECMSAHQDEEQEVAV
jgi:hypothetical protein